MSEHFVPRSILAKYRHPVPSTDDRELCLWMRITDPDVYRAFVAGQCTAAQKYAIHEELRRRCGELTAWLTHVEWDRPTSMSDIPEEEPEEPIAFVLTAEGRPLPWETDREEQWRMALNGYWRGHRDDRPLYRCILSNILERMPPEYHGIFKMPDTL